jgi:hypothetical protein
MVKGELLKKDGFVALVFSLLFLIGVMNGASCLERRERIADDAGMPSAQHRLSATKTQVIGLPIFQSAPETGDEFCPAVHKCLAAKSQKKAVVA